jgi:hypothetical protein
MYCSLTLPQDPIVHPPKKRGRPRKELPLKQRNKSFVMNSYQAYVKENFVKESQKQPDLSNAQVMSVISAQWKLLKESREAGYNP